MAVCEFRILFDEGQRSFRLGETVSGRVTVEVFNDCQCRDLKLSRQWRTHGKGNRTKGMQQSQSIARSLEWKKGRVYEYRFEFAAPSEPQTYHGHYLNVDWYLKATAEISWGATRLMAGYLRHPSYVTEILLLPAEKPLTVNHAPATRDSSQSFVIVGTIITLVGIAILIFQITQDNTRLGQLAWGLVPMAIGVALAFYNSQNALAQRRLGPVAVQVFPGIIENSLQTKVSFQSRRSMVIRSVSTNLTVCEQVTEGSGSNSKTYKHTLFSKRGPEIEQVDLARNQPFERTLLLEVPDHLPATFDENDNKIIWEMDFEVVPAGWHRWKRKLMIQVYR